MKETTYRVFRSMTDGHIYVLRLYGDEWAGGCGPLRADNRTPFGSLTYSAETRWYIQRELVRGRMTLLTKSV